MKEVHNYKLIWNTYVISAVDLFGFIFYSYYLCLKTQTNKFCC